MNKHIKTVINAAIKAGKEIINIYQKDFDVEIKSDNSPLTIADKNANDIINSYLLKTDIPIISEENKQTNYTTRKNWNQCWIVDPLDGTKEFIKRNGEFTVNIALIENQKPKLGVIYVPVTKELFVGLVNENKAYKTIVDENFNTSNFLTTRFELKQKVLKKIQKDIIKIVGIRSHMNKDTEDFVNSFKNQKTEIVSKGSSLKFCLVAEGKADIYPRFAPTMEWDTAAGQAICEAVGLQVISKETNKPLLYNKENLLNPHFIVK
jgi:3'(2'), 5'-bisphosphate nucleotidase